MLSWDNSIKTFEILLAIPISISVFMPQPDILELSAITVANSPNSLLASIINRLTPTMRLYCLRYIQPLLRFPVVIYVVETAQHIMREFIDGWKIKLLDCGDNPLRSSYSSGSSSGRIDATKPVSRRDMSSFVYSGSGGRNNEV